MEEHEEMNVLIIHSGLNTIGGAERVCLATIEALGERKHDIVLGTVDKSDWDRVERFYGKIIRPDEELFLFFRRIPYFSIYQRMLTISHGLRKSKWADVIFNAHGDALPFSFPAEKLVTYMHFPRFTLQRYFSKYQKGLGRIYFQPYRNLQRRFMEALSRSTVLTNSNFSASVIKENLGYEANVIYPPVDVDTFYSEEKENIVTSVGRYTPEKNYEILIKAMKNVKNARCVIIGSSAGKVSEPYITKLKTLISELKLEECVSLLIAAPFKLLKETLAKAKIYVHAMRFEHFGISVVEAMASGCVPIVNRSGGPYTDIIDHNKHGFSFKTTEELSNKINLLLGHKELRKEYSERAVKRSKKFGKEVFKQEIVRVLESVGLH